MNQFWTFYYIFLNNFKDFFKAYSLLITRMYTQKCCQLILSSDNKTILLTTRNVRLDSGRYTTKYYFWKNKTEKSFSSIGSTKLPKIAKNGNFTQIVLHIHFVRYFMQPKWATREWLKRMTQAGHLSGQTEWATSAGHPSRPPEQVNRVGQPIGPTKRVNQAGQPIRPTKWAQKWASQATPIFGEYKI